MGAQPYAGPSLSADMGVELGHLVWHITSFDAARATRAWCVWSPSGHYLAWGSRTRGTVRKHVISGAVGVWGQ
jgi:hypothetical protein